MKDYCLLITVTLFYLTLCSDLLAQSGQNFFAELSLKMEGQTFSINTDMRTVNGEKQLVFNYGDVNPFCELKLYPRSAYNFTSIELLASKDYTITDSLININDSHFRTKIQFNQLTQSDFLQLTFALQAEEFDGTYIYELKLFPVTETEAYLRPKDNKLFIGEEQIINIETNRPNNFELSNQWTQGLPIDYKLSKARGQVQLHLLPNRPGKHQVQIPLKLRKPMLDSLRNIVYELPPLEYTFTVTPSKLVFLNINKNELSLSKGNRLAGKEVELEYHPDIGLEKTYRLEQQEKAGGALIAELFTRSVLSSGRILCQLRVFNEHRTSEGYLYIKDGDQAKFLTNFNITPPTRVDKFEVVALKGNQSQGNNIYPGEAIEVRIEGEGLHKAQFGFEGLESIVIDSLISNENRKVYKAKVPFTVDRDRILLYQDGRPTGKSLQVKEYSVPKPLDFVSIRINDEPDRKVNDLDQTVLIDHTIQDLVIVFDREQIDKVDRLFGPQHLTIDLQISDRKGKLVDKRTINDLVLCPGESSLRYGYYDSRNCLQQNININKYIRGKTSDLEEWSTIEIEIRHDRNRHGGGFSKKMQFIRSRYTTFDIEVSFPAGLLIRKEAEDGFGNFSGVSMAMIAQFSFYHPKRIAKYRPYKIGAGFLALNAFNFSENATNRDVGVVILGSLYPLQNSRSKLSFPLFLGGGYFLSEEKFFYLLGPGLRLRI